MQTIGKYEFNRFMRDRTLEMSIKVNLLFQPKKISLVNRSVVNQIIRSSSSVAANFRATTRARSDAEFYSKICIATEECDETQFWLEYLVGIGVLVSEEIISLRQEVDEILKILTSIKKKMKEKRDSAL